MRRTALWALLLLPTGCAGGPPPGAWPPFPLLRIEGTPEFRTAASAALERIRNTRTGAELLARLRRAGATVTIRYGFDPWGGANTYWNGKGDSTIAWDPTFELHRFPPFLGLYHELVHAWYNAVGEYQEGLPAEEKAIGLGKFKGSEVSENAMRRELGIPERPRWDYPRRYPPEED